MSEILALLPLVLLLYVFSLLLSAPQSGERGVARKLGLLWENNAEYHPFNNVILKTPDGTTQIDHILVSPYGVFVIETKNYKGWIFGEAHQKSWTQSLCRGSYHSAKYHFQNPIHQNYKHVKAVQDFFGINPECIFNVVVFTGGCEFKTEMPENVRRLYDLVPYIESHTRVFFDGAKTKELVHKLADYVENPPLNTEDHLESLADNQRHPTCPQCGKRMVLRTARKGPSAGLEFWGCVNFPSCRVTKPVK